MKLHLKHLCVTVLSILFLCINVFADPDQFTVSVSNGNKFTISRTDASAASYVDYYTQSGSAVAGIHYVEKSGRLVFNAGETTKTVTIDLYSLRKTIDDYAKNSELRKYFFVVYNNYMSPIRTEGYFSTGNSYSEPPERQITICDSYTQHDKLAYETASQCLRNVHSPTDEEYYTITQQTPKYKFNVSFDTYEVVDGYYFIGIYLNGNKSDPYKSNGLAAVLSGASQNIYNACWERNGRVGNTYKIKFPVKGMGQSDNTINAFVWNNSSYWSIGNTNDYLYTQYFNANYYSGWSSSDGYFIESDGTKKVGIALNASGQDDDAFYIGNPVVNVKLYDDVAPVITGIYINTSHIYYSGERVYMAVRFNELVDHHVSYATVNIGGTNYTFTYSGGDYTNTLYFYCNNIT
ncbi:MAG: hypothetical protein J6X43_00970, partial [Bacteroidales bacterium]|nr:hypothetical protein [Bacteroidales bacterium]